MQYKKRFMHEKSQDFCENTWIVEDIFIGFPIFVIFIPKKCGQAWWKLEILIDYFA